MTVFVKPRPLRELCLRCLCSIMMLTPRRINTYKVEMCISKLYICTQSQLYLKRQRYGMEFEDQNAKLRVINFDGLVVQQKSKSLMENYFPIILEVYFVDPQTVAKLMYYFLLLLIQAD